MTDRDRRQTMGRRASDRERVAKAKCPACGHWDSLVLQGWEDPRGRGYLRRRHCQRCATNYRTIETIDLTFKVAVRLRRTS